MKFVLTSLETIRDIEETIAGTVGVKWGVEKSGSSLGIGDYENKVE